MRHFLALGQRVQGEVAQVVAIAHADVDQESVGAGHVIAGQYLGQHQQVLVEAVDQCARMACLRMAYGYRDSDYLFLKIRAAFRGNP